MNGDEGAAYRLILHRSINADTNNDVEQTNRITIVDNRKEKENKKKKVKVRFNDVTDNAIQLTTGFPSLTTMLGFMMIVSNGDIEKLTETTTTLTWFEEWLLYFEVIYGKSLPRWADVRIKYDLSNYSCRMSFDDKLIKVLDY